MCDLQIRLRTFVFVQRPRWQCSVLDSCLGSPTRQFRVLLDDPDDLILWRAESSMNCLHSHKLAMIICWSWLRRKCHVHKSITVSRLCLRTVLFHERSDDVLVYVMCNICGYWHPTSAQSRIVNDVTGWVMHWYEDDSCHSQWKQSSILKRMLLRRWQCSRTSILRRSETYSVSLKDL